MIDVFKVTVSSKVCNTPRTGSFIDKTGDFLHQTDLYPHTLRVQPSAACQSNNQAHFTH